MKTNTITRTFGATLLAIATLATSTSLHAAEPGVIITNSVDSIQSTDWTSNWRRVDGGYAATGNLMIASQGSLTPKEGSAFWSGGNTSGSATNRGIARYFPSETLQVGTYTATFYIGQIDTETITSFTNNFTISLLADTSKGNDYNWNERLPATAITITENPTPGAGKWEKWTYTFTITADTKNAAGNSVVGSTLGFLIVSLVPDKAGYAFDSLTISYAPPAAVPEPGVTAAVAGLVALIAVAFYHRRFGK
ncbi:cell wall anchor protein [Opitutaceae bacterium TAV4]|nr:cell wall anchor protein [Opitutaceae bacterium TAV4]RRK00257.1 cell wall anchor protein [Opitutaceae bacterium TAV3]